ncbi:hypothetical protein UH38_14495 [Aliterella atlantica CENA595]|uniref:Uncharacterized protein n=2 Tax=Aliterella TaxID=1827277 RepID=A0A0D8ZRD7_9CYAN|nr:hypothetical protein UH38_14495 [Aliterella atlantica CENA595]
MNEKAIDNNSSSGILILILPIAILIVFLFATWRIILALLLFSVGLNLWQQYQWQKWSQQVDPLFYNLIQHNQGSITPLDLAMKANFSAATAKRYLESKAHEFGAQCRNYESQDPIYYFMTASILGSILDDSEPVRSLPQSQHTEQLALSEESIATPSAPDSEAPENLEASDEAASDSSALIQSDLAKRLDVHSSTIYKRRDDADFSEWTKTRDPEGIAWAYDPETRLFSPLVLEAR